MTRATDYLRLTPPARPRAKGFAYLTAAGRIGVCVRAVREHPDPQIVLRQMPEGHNVPEVEEFPGIQTRGDV
ncbi:hypothetical protein GGE46_000043 [Rhizobium etli]|uniref:Uncharacterized protein n=1 Tax=Rhizobium etli TaxID=29449 RepID=A0A7W6V629_RHIET|nr:hypothetical protein [Rhizobium etli]MBB4533334.1 hypothetical protein [Rhizobium etli]